jgi:hypothetical protein
MYYGLRGALFQMEGFAGVLTTPVWLAWLIVWCVGGCADVSRGIHCNAGLAGLALTSKIVITPHMTLQVTCSAPSI